MADFSQIQKQVGEPSGTIRYTFHEIEGEPWLDLVSATEYNKPYFNDLLKKQRQNRRALRSGNVSVNTIKYNRSEDLTLYAKHIIKGWGNVVDSKGKTVTFSKPACSDFLKALPNWIFDDLRNFAADPLSFNMGESDEESEKN